MTPTRTLRVFTRASLGGTPVPVFDDADACSPSEMQSLAAALGAPTTAFVLRARREDCAARVRVFSPTRELPMEVAPMLAVASIKSPSCAVNLELGVLAVRVEPEGERWGMHLPRTLLGTISIDDRDTLASVFALAGEDVDPSLPIVSASSGLGVLLVAVRDEDALARAALVTSLWPLLIEKARVVGAMLFTAPASDGTSRARMFSPGTGVSEDLASGAAAGPLAMLVARARGSAASVRVVQGRAGECEVWAEASVLADGGGVVRVAGSVVQT